MYRLLIADDEADIRTGLAGFVTRSCPDFEVVGQAQDGREALQMARTLLPDVVVTDIAMPHMNGLDFLEALSDVLPDAKMLVISGYDQFEYAVQAMRHGVREYLLKPLDTDRFLAALEKLRRELEEQAARWEQMESLHRDVQEKQAHARWKYCRAALTGEPLPAETALPIAAPGGNWMCVICQGAEPCAQVLPALVEQQLYAVAQAVCVNLGSPSHTCFVLRFSQEKRGQIFVPLNHAFTSVAVYLRRTLQQNVHFFLSNAVSSPEKLSGAYRQSVEAMEYAFWENAGPVTSYKEVLTDRLLVCTRPPEQFMLEIPAAVEAENRIAFYAGVEALFDWFARENIRDAGYMRMCVMQFCFSILDSGSGHTALTYLEFTNVQAEIAAAPTLKELRACLENFAEVLFLRRKQEKPVAPMLSQKVEEIVRRHLSDLEFSLDVVAGELFISPNYLRQLFKQQTGQTFVEYLTGQRMQHARMLLGNPEMKVSAAAEQSGYVDARYFSVVFKKYYQQTPSEYQAALQAQL